MDERVEIQLGFERWLLPAKGGRVDLHAPEVQRLMMQGRFWLGQIETDEDRDPPQPIEGPLRWRQPRTNPAPDGYWEAEGEPFEPPQESD